MKYDIEYFQKSADYVLSKISKKPDIAMILGTALGPLSEKIENQIVIPYEDIPNFLLSTVDGHAGKLIYGTLNGKTIICMSGRFHYYEGYSYEELVIPIRLFKLLGAETVILTNAVGGINYDYNPGDICVIKDHINLAGVTPLRGKNVDELGVRFPSLNTLYTKELRELAKKCGRSLDFELKEGNYFFATGPHFETPSEIRAMRILGADVVGMSTISEAITAAHCGMKVLCLSLITNKSSDQVIDHELVEGAFQLEKVVTERFSSLVGEIVKSM